MADLKERLRTGAIRHRSLLLEAVAILVAALVAWALLAALL